MINLFYVSISGNTRAFVKRLCAYAEQQHAKNADAYQINAVEYSESVDVRIMDQPFFAMVPTYLDGGDGINNGYKEVMTLDFRDELDAGNTENLLGDRRLWQSQLQCPIWLDGQALCPPLQFACDRLV